MVKHGLTGLDLLVLLCVVAKGCLMANFDFAHIGGLHTSQDAEEGCLAGTVQAHDDHSFTTVNIDIDINKDHIVIEGFG